MAYRREAPEIDAALDSFARSLQERKLGNYQTIHIEEPDEVGVTRLFTWQRGGTTYAISMLAGTPIADRTLVWGNVYRDNSDTHIRKHSLPEFRWLPFPSSTEIIQQTMNDLFKDLRSKSRWLNLNGRHQGVGIVLAG